MNGLQHERIADLCAELRMNGLGAGFSVATNPFTIV